MFFSSAVRNFALASGKFGRKKNVYIPQRIAGIPSIMKSQLFANRS